jgi:hypothetical protein
MAPSYSPQIRPLSLLLQFQPEGEYMSNLKGLESIVSQLREQRTNFVNQLRHVDAALAVLGKLEGGRSYTEPRRHGRRKMTAKSRKRIAAAQKARRAAWRAKHEKKVTPVVGKRTLSASARRKIAAAQRARWAKVRATQQKKAA